MPTLCQRPEAGKGAPENCKTHQWRLGRILMSGGLCAQMELYKSEWRKVENLAKESYIHTVSVNNKQAREEWDQSRWVAQTFLHILRMLWIKNDFVYLPGKLIIVSMRERIPVFNSGNLERISL